MARHDDTKPTPLPIHPTDTPEPPPQPAASTLTQADIAMIAAIVKAVVGTQDTAASVALAARAEVVKILTASTPDVKMGEDMRRARGQDRPQAREFLVPCKSPITGSTFNARCVCSPTYPDGSVVELLDYRRPDGFDRAKSEGGLYPLPKDTMLADPAFGHPPGTPSIRFKQWCYETFLRADMRAMLPGGDLDRVPVGGLADWRTDVQRLHVGSNSRLFTEEMIARLTPQQREALEQLAQEPGEKAAE